MTDKWFVRGVPADLAQQVKDAAHAANMTVGSWVVRALRASLAAGPPADPTDDLRLRLEVIERVADQVTALADRVDQIEARIADQNQTSDKPVSRARKATRSARGKKAPATRETPVRPSERPDDGGVTVTDEQYRDWFTSLEPKRLSAAGDAEIKRRHDAGESLAQIGRVMRLTKQAVHQRLKKTAASR